MLRVIQAGHLVDLDTLQVSDTAFVRIVSDAGEVIDLPTTAEGLQALVGLVARERTAGTQQAGPRDPGTAPRRAKGKPEPPEDPGTADEPDFDDTRVWGDADDTGGFSPFSTDEETP